MENNVNKFAFRDFILEVKLTVNTNLFEKGYITEEMFTKAKELIIQQAT